MKWSFESDDAAAAHAARAGFTEYLQNRATGDSDISAAELIYGELVGNVVRHAPGPIAISVQWSGEKAELRVHDHGPGFSYTPELPRDVYSETGRGLFIVAALCDELHIVSNSHRGATVSALLPVRHARV